MLLTLIGYRATGKTTLATLLAERLGWDWADSDDEIERRAGMSIAEIFAAQGEAAFRDVESDVLADLCSRDRLVLATGGGAPMRAENRRLISTSGRVVWLRATPETILARMNDDRATAARRPPLTDAPAEREIVQVLQERTPVYREMADIIIDTDGRMPKELVDDIIHSNLVPTVLRGNAMPERSAFDPPTTQ